MFTLINPQGVKILKGLQYQSPSPPIGPAYLSAFLKQKNISVTTIDACGEKLNQIYPHALVPDVWIQGLTVKEVLERIPVETKIVGLSVLFAHSWPLAVEIAKVVKKKFPQMWIVAGGEQSSADYEQVLNSGYVDLVVFGEGEETAWELYQRLSSNQHYQDLLGIIYKNEKGEIVKNPPRKRITNIDDFPYPDWNSWYLENYIEHNQVTGVNFGRSMPILGSRGCPYACTFCSNEAMWTRRYIMRDPQSIVDEMEYMKKSYRVTGFNFMDSTFIINGKKIKNFAKELIARKLNVVYQLPSGTRCEAIEAEMANLLSESGLVNFSFAPESGSAFILKKIKKQINIEKFLSAVKVILETKISLGVFFVIGFPEDDKHTLKETLKLIRTLALMGVHDVTVSKFHPYPGSLYYDQLKEKGLIKESDNSENNFINFYNLAGKSYCDKISPKKLSIWMIWMFSNFYFLSFLRYPWRPIINLLIYFKQGTEKTKYMRLFSEIFSVRKEWKNWIKVSNVSPKEYSPK